MKKANIVKEARIVHITASALIVIAGVIFTAWPDLVDIAVRWMLGGIFAMMGIARILGYFSNDLYRLAFQYDLALGSFCVIFGVLIVISPENAQPAIPYAIGMYVLLDGLLKLQTAFDAKEFGMKQWIGLLASSALLSVAGVLALLGFGFSLPERTLFGVALALDGAENAWNTMGTFRVRVKNNERFEKLF